MLTLYKTAWLGLALPAAALLLVPVQSSLAGDQVPYSANVYQTRDYNRGVEAWKEARTAPASDRARLLDKAERALEEASGGKKLFPEATLALGLVRYSQNDLAAAEAPLKRVADSTRGSLRIEALTYLGFIHLRTNRFDTARSAFDGAVAESPDITSWRGWKRIKEPLENLERRTRRLQRVSRVGSLVSGYYLAQGSSEADYAKLLDDIARLVPASDVSELEQELNGVDAALVSYEGQPDWNRNLMDGPPQRRPPP